MLWKEIESCHKNIQLQNFVAGWQVNFQVKENILHL